MRLLWNNKLAQIEQALHMLKNHAKILADTCGEHKVARGTGVLTEELGGWIL